MGQGKRCLGTSTYHPWIYTSFIVQEITDMLNRWQVPRRASLDVAASKEYAAGDKIVVGLQVGQRR